MKVYRKNYDWVFFRQKSPWDSQGDRINDFLRIFSEDMSYDIALRLRLLAGGIMIAMPIFVLSDGFPTAVSPVKKGSRIRIRPKISVLPNGGVDDNGVRRIIEWSLSKKFRPVKCDDLGTFQVATKIDFSHYFTETRSNQASSWTT